jgi:hypothetical protein
VLEPLRFVAAGNAQPDGRRENTPDCAIKADLLSDGKRQVHGREHGAHHRPLVADASLDARGQEADRLIRPDPGRSCGQRPSLHPARTVRYGVGEKHVGELVELVEPRWFHIRGIEQRERAVPRLFEHRHGESLQRGQVRNFTALPGRFEAARMREAAGWKARVDELPGQEVFRLKADATRTGSSRSHLQNRKYRCASGSTVAGCERSGSPSAVTT